MRAPGAIRSGRVTRFVATLALTFALGAPGASAAQMDPAGPPSQSGPIVLANESYETQSCSKRTYEGAVVSKTCRYFFRYDTSQETDPENDYGFWWFQSRFEPKPGYCLAGAKVSVSLDGGTVIGSSEKRKQVSRREQVGNRISGDAAGSSGQASLRNRFVVSRGEFVSHLRETGVLKLRWAGRAGTKTIGLAGGVEGSWPAQGPLPAYTVSEGPTFKPC